MFSDNTTTTSVQVHVLKTFEELRLDVSDTSEIIVKLEKGKAEIFGTEVSRGREYRFRNTSFSIFTFHGCIVNITGSCHSYVKSWSKIEEIPLLECVNNHDYLQNVRDTEGIGKRVMIVGPKDSGKTSLSKFLFSYAARMKQKVAYVDLNVHLGVVSIPTCISCVCSKNRPFDINSHFSNFVPLVYFYGDFDYSSNLELYMRLVNNLSKILTLKVENDFELQRGGYIVDTGNYDDNKTYVDIAEMYRIDIIYVIGGGRLLHDLKELFRNQNVVVRSITRSDGVDEKKRVKKKVMGSVRRYFYGARDLLGPHNYTIKFSEFVLLKVGGALSAPKSTLPIGTKSIIDKCQLYVQTPTVELTSSVLAVSNAEEIDNVLNENVYGFVHVLKVDLFKDELKILVPSPEKIKKKYFIMGSLKWIDDK